MENEIKVGEYIRTKDGRIGTFEEIDEHCRHFGERLEDKIYIIHTEKNEYLRLIENDIVKHSSNLIDLIQCGDYVNGRKIERIVDISHKHNSIIVVYDGELWNEEIMEEDIENIVTKEQFESISYKVTKM